MSQTGPIATIASPFGMFGIEANDTHITQSHWNAEPRGPLTPLLQDAVEQMRGYLDGTLHQFDLPLAPAGTPFEKQVYAAMLAIPFGETRSYGDLATMLDAFPQAIGQACGSNPIPVIIPCHRVTASNGLGGFSGDGGVETKITLLRHEGAYGLLI